MPAARARRALWSALNAQKRAFAEADSSKLLESSADALHAYEELERSIVTLYDEVRAAQPDATRVSDWEGWNERDLVRLVKLEAALRRLALEMQARRVLFRRAAQSRASLMERLFGADHSDRPYRGARTERTERLISDDA